MPTGDNFYYTLGTVALTNGSKIVTGAGTGWVSGVDGRFGCLDTLLVQVAAGDWREATIFTLDSATQATLSTVWAGPTVVGASYRVSSRALESDSRQLQALLDLLKRGTAASAFPELAYDNGLARLRIEGNVNGGVDFLHGSTRVSGAPETALTRVFSMTSAGTLLANNPDGSRFRAVSFGPATTPPGSPTEGVLALVADSPSGGFAGQARKIALYFNGEWHFSTPAAGCVFRVADTDVYWGFNATTGWVSYKIPVGLVSGVVEAGNNIHLGASTFSTLTTGVDNLAIGSFALQYITTANYNVALGTYSLRNNTSGGYNISIGQQSLFYNTTGNYNSSVGTYNLFYNTTGSYNVALGYQPLFSNTTGTGNTGVGSLAIYGNTTGNYNTALGYQALVTGVSYSNSTGLGANATVTGSNQIQLGDAATTTYVYGTVQNRSDARDKTNITPTELGLDFVLKLNPVDFQWDLREDYRSPFPETPDKKSIKNWTKKNQLKTIKRDGSKARSRRHSGLIAQDVQALLEDMGLNWGGLQDHSRNGGEEVMSLGYDQFIAPLIRAVQELSAKVAALEAQIK